MAELLVQFDEPVQDGTGTAYIARAWGGEDDIGRWNGWLEYTPVNGGEPLCTDRETTQPNRRDLEYWVTGLSRVYLEGGLTRAQAAHTRVRDAAEHMPRPEPD